MEPLERVGKKLGLDRLFIKRDDLSGVIYGGNKVRKLEFLLGDALRTGAREVVTMGFAGSNHALATAIYADRLGLRCASILMPQVNAHYVRRNLKAACHFHAEMIPCAGAALLMPLLLGRMIHSRLRDGVFPRFIPGGGSCPLGAVGYVSAALELAEQVRDGQLPEPDVIYVPMGSMGTSAGLALGLKAAGLKSRLVAVRVIEKRWAGPRALRRLMRRTDALLRKLEPAFPSLAGAEETLTIREDCLGDGYARFTENGVKAAELLRDEAGIVLNGSYSAKAFSAILDDAPRGLVRNQIVLFWNTYNSRDLSAAAAGVDYHQLPPAFHRYFDEDVQPLDRSGADR